MFGFEAYESDDNITLTGSSAFPAPADAHGAAGPTRLINAVNKGLEIWHKSGVLMAPPTSLESFFSPAPPPNLGSTPFDPKVVYDHYMGRFLVMALEKTSDAASILVAVSKTPTPGSLTAADWHYLPIDAELTIGGAPCWADFPGFEVDEEAVYVTVNYLTYSAPVEYKGSRLWIIAKAGFYSGLPLPPAVYDPYIAGIHTVHQPAQVFGPGGAGPGIGTYLLGYGGITDPSDEEHIQVVRVNDPLGVPTFVVDIVSVGDIEVDAPMLPLPFAPQPGGPEMLATNSRQALDAVWRSGKLYLTANIDPSPAYDPVNAGQNTAHLFRLDTSAITSSGSSAGLITFDRQVSIGGEDIAPGAHTYYPSVAVDGVGGVKIGYCASSAVTFAGAYVSSVEMPGFTEGAPEVVHPGMDYYDRTSGGGAGVSKWGDYSGISVDPGLPRHYWVYNQYAALRESPPDGVDGRWGTAWMESKDFLEALPETLTLVLSPGDLCDTVRVANLGDSDLTFTSVTGCSSGGFVLDINGLPPTLAPGDTAFLRVCHTPGGPADSCRVVIASDAGTEYVAVTTTAVTAVGDDPAGQAAFAVSVGTSPFRNSTSVTLSLSWPEWMKAEVYDVRGRRVRVLLPGQRLEAGTHRLPWDGRDAAGSEVASGLYFVRVSSQGDSRVVPIVRLR